MIYQYNKPSELLARQKQTGESYWDMIGNPLPKYTGGKSTSWEPSQKVRKGVAYWEGSHFAGQNKKFGGDAVGVKAKELNNILSEYGLNTDSIPQGMYDALLSQYYNISPTTFKNYTGRYIQDYVKNQDALRYNMLRDAIYDRWKLAGQKYQKGIRRRTTWERDLVPTWEIWKGETNAAQKEQNSYIVPADATKVTKPEIVPEKIPYHETEQIKTEQPIAYQSTLPDIMSVYQRMTNGQIPLQNLTNGDYGYDDYTEA